MIEFENAVANVTFNEIRGISVRFPRRSDPSRQVADERPEVGNPLRGDGDTHRSHVEPASRPRFCHQARPEAAAATAVGAAGSLLGWQTPTDLLWSRHPGPSFATRLVPKQPRRRLSELLVHFEYRPSFRVFFSTLLTLRPRLVFLSITVLVNTLANVLHLPG